MVEVKKTFEYYAQTYKLNINKYHTYNGLFSDNAFLQAFAQEIQTIAYCGVNAHFQNHQNERLHTFPLIKSPTTYIS